MFRELENFIIISINKTRLLIWNLKQQMFTMSNKKQPLEEFYKETSSQYSQKKNLCLSLFLIKLWSSGLQFIKKRFQHRCFSMNIAKFLKTVILKKICERLLLNNVERNYLSMKTKIGVKCFSTFAGKHLYRSVLFNRYSCSMQLKSIFIQKEVPALVFFWQLSEIFNNNFLKSIVIRNVDQISISNLITQLFI